MWLPAVKRRVRFRHRLQFGLRSLLVFMMIVCLGLGWYVERVRRQRAAVAALREAGAGATYYPFRAGEADFADGIEKPRGVREWVEWSTPQGLRADLGIDFFRRVHCVGFGFYTDFPSSLERLRDLPGLAELDTHFALDEDLGHIGALGGLKHLELCDSVISDAGLARLSELRNLEHLELPFDEGALKVLYRQPITDAGLAHLANLRRLTVLDLSGSSVSGAGLRHLAGMSNLDWLDLSHTMVTDQGLAPLRSLTHLRVIYLSGTAITDQGLRVLGDIASLEHIDISDTAATSDGAAWLQRRLPKASVSFSDTSFGGLDIGSVQDIVLNRARVQMRAGRWRQAIERLSAPEASRLEPVERLYHLGWCYAETGQWDQAKREFCETLDRLVRREPGILSPYNPDSVWQRIYAFPQVFDLVARARPDDLWRWATPAQRAVLEGRWSSAAADYARAAECEGIWKNRELAFQYGAARMLEGDLPAVRRLSAELLERERQTAESFTAGYYKNVALRISYLAPQGALAAPQIADCPLDELLPLAYYRAAQFEKVLGQPRPIQEGGGVFLFCRAMAYQRLGRAAQARDCFAQGTHWLNRRMKRDRLCGIQRYAGDFLQTEVLRREAKRLIFN